MQQELTIQVVGMDVSAHGQVKYFIDNYYIGTYTSSTGASTLEYCSSGTYSGNGATSCTAIPEGY